MDVLGVKTSYLKLSRTPAGIVEKIRRQRSAVWFWIFDSYSDAHFSTSHTGKTHCFVETQTGNTCTESALCVGKHENKCQASCPFHQHRLQTVLSQFAISPAESCLLTFDIQQSAAQKNQGRYPTRTQQLEKHVSVSLYCHRRYITKWSFCAKHDQTICTTDWTQVASKCTILTCIWRCVVDP